VKRAEFTERLEARAAHAGIALTTPQVDRLSDYFDLLRNWTRKINLTALQLDPLSDEALDRLLLEPLAAARALSHDPVLLQDDRACWLDIGSGGGSPAIPMKVALPKLPLAMIESKSRKAAFLREVVRALQFGDAEVLSTRVEEIRGLAAPASLVTARAVRIDSGLLVAVAALMRPSGRLAIFRATASQPPLSGFDVLAGEQLLPASPSWLHVYARMFHVEHNHNARRTPPKTG
jgi:16S rRNA (guanine527-N7)-methyltransferase